jgi:hypothetical protein
MILPTKYLKEHESLIGVGAILLRQLSIPKTLSNLWEETKHLSNVGTYERFVLGLDLLFVLGLIEVNGEKIIKVFI